MDVEDALWMPENTYQMELYQERIRGDVLLPRNAYIYIAWIEYTAIIGMGCYSWPPNCGDNCPQKIKPNYNTHSPRYERHVQMPAHTYKPVK
jgi:hypothetical protein